MAKAKLTKLNVKIGFMNEESNEPIWIIDKVATLNQIAGKLPQVAFECLATRGYVLYRDDDNVYYNISKI